MSAARSLFVSAAGVVCLVGACDAGAAATPAFTYNAATGVLHMDGDLDSGATVVSWLIDGPPAEQILAFQDGTASLGSDWVQGFFAGKEQWIAVTGPGSTGGWDIARYAPGLDLNVFGPVEFGLRHTNGGGETGFTAVTAPATLEGDLDTDGFVGIGDLNIVLGNWNQSAPPGDTRADPSGDGFIGIEDLNRVLGNWNAGTPPTDPALVPEVSCVSLFGVGCLALVRRGRRETRMDD